MNFTNSRGLKLEGILSDVGGKIVIIAHGFGSDLNSMTASLLASELSKKGVSSLRFSFSGCGNSGGVFGEQTISTNVDDMISAITTVEGDYEKIGLFGISYGGGVVLATALKRDDFYKIGLKAPNANFPGWIKERFGDQALEQWRKNGYVDYSFEKGVVQVKYDLYEDAVALDVNNRVGKIVTPVMIVHGDDDELVNIKYSRDLVERLPNGRLIEIAGGNHALASDGEIEAQFAEWFVNED